MNILTTTQGYFLITLFSLAMIGLTWLSSKGKKTGVSFLVSNRNISWKLGSLSIAASWLWAPALFVSIQKAYELGLPGLFWFTAPNVLALIIFAFLAPAIRKKLPGGYTLPDWIRFKLKDDSVHRLYMIPYIWYQVMAICVQIFVGGMMLNYLTGIPLNTVMFLLLAVALSYSLISGLTASIITDVVQMIFIIIGLVILIPWIISTVGSDAIIKGIGGLVHKTNIFDPAIAFSFGIVTSIGLIAGAISDQQYWQRSFAIKERDLIPSFVVGGILFGLVPIALSVLGFLAANPDMGITLPAGTGLPMIGIATVQAILPAWATVLFVIMLLAGLTSTLDSGLCAASSLYAIDASKIAPEEAKILAKENNEIQLSPEEIQIKSVWDKKVTVKARVAMFGIAALGLATAFIVQHLFSLDRLWWIFNGVASMFVVPTILSIFYKGISAKGVKYGIYGSFIGMLFFVYGNWVQNDIITVFSALFIIVISLITNYIFRNKEA